MGIKTFKPITPGQRGKTGYTFDEITKANGPNYHQVQGWWP